MSLIKNIITAQTTTRREVEDLSWRLETPMQIDGREPDVLVANCKKNIVNFKIYEEKGKIYGIWGDRERTTRGPFAKIDDAKADANAFRRGMLGLDVPVEIPVRLSLPPLGEWTTDPVKQQSWCPITRTVFEVTKTEKGFVPSDYMRVFEDDPVSTVEEAKAIIETWRHEIVLPHITVTSAPAAPAVNDGIVWETAKGEGMTMDQIGDSHLTNILRMVTARRDAAQEDMTKAKGISTIIYQEKADDWNAKIVLFTAEAERRAQLADPSASPM